MVETCGHDFTIDLVGITMGVHRCPLISQKISSTVLIFCIYLKEYTLSLTKIINFDRAAELVFTAELFLCDPTPRP